MHLAKIAAIKKKLFIGEEESLVLYRMTWKEWWNTRIANPCPRPASFPWWNRITAKYVWEDGFDAKRVLGNIAPKWIDFIERKKMMIRYKCVFSFIDNKCVVSSDEGISVFTNGFWITKDVRLTKGADSKYWIPPSAIRYIEKMKGSV